MQPQVGQKTIPLKDWSRFLKIADWWDQTYGHRPPSVVTPNGMRDWGTIRIKNESGADVDRFGILGIDDLLTDVEEPNPVFSGIEPATPDHYGKFAVLLNSLVDDDIGLACVAGVVNVQVSFTYSDSPYADVLDGDDAKLVGSEGGMPILYKETGTGTKWALVQMGVPHYPVIRGTLDAALTVGSSATMSVWDGATLADSGRNVTVYDWWLGTGRQLASGTKVSATWHSGKWYLEVSADCDEAIP